MKHNGGRSPDEIQAEIERTRGDMHATLSAIEQRLTPGQLIDQGLDYLKHSGAREFGSNLGNSVKNNPVPVALMGIGMAWLMITGNRKPSYAYPRPAHEGSSLGSGAGSGIGDSASSMMGRASQGVASAKNSVSQTAQSAKERLSQTTEAARQRVGQVGQTAREQMERVHSSYDSMVREQPLALGAIGLAIGALLAAVTPRTRREDELMGEASDRLTEKAKELGKEQLGKAQQVASAAKDAAMGEAEKQGISPRAVSGASPQSGGAQSTPWSKPSGRPNVIEPARSTPMSESTVDKNPGSGKPGGGRS